MLTGVIEQPITSQSLADRIYAEVEELQRQLDELPNQIAAHRALAAESIDDKKIAASLATAEELEKVTMPALKIKLWHRQKDYLQAHKAALITMEIELRDGQVALAKDDFNTAQAVLDAAKVQLATAKQRRDAIAGQLRGIGIQRQELEGEIQRHERSKPVI